MEHCLQFWGKTSHPALGDTDHRAPRATYKPALHHLIDVAAVAWMFLTANTARARREASLIGLSPEAYRDLMAFLAGLHDLGKFAPNFQFKAPELWPPTLGARPAAVVEQPNHWRATARFLKTTPLCERLKLHFAPALRTGDWSIIAAVAGHHGVPPDESDNRRFPGDANFHPASLAAAVRAYDAIERLTGGGTAPGLDDDAAPLFSFRLSGLITLADWVGSDAQFFPLSPIDTPLDEYWRAARANSQTALRAKGLIAFRPWPRPSLKRLSARAAAAPRPMQIQAGDLAIRGEPQLVIIEDTTGSGKTEAALLIAARMIAAGCGDGLYFALPTMATANAMHSRLINMVAALFAFKKGGAQPSLILAHGKAELARTLTALEAQPLGDDADSAAATCNAWIADDRRRSLFADVGAGTIDQAFLAVVRKKHLTLRQYALAGRILIIDEAHCFDAYMREELSALLRLHAMNGGSAIVLSATLSLGARRKIAQAFFQGLGASPNKAARSAQACASSLYPLLTRLDASGVEERNVIAAESLRRSVRVERVDHRLASLRAASEAAERGAAVLVICNAVDEAVGAQATLLQMRPNDKVHLFHARFAQGDRIAIEDRALERFGREAEDSNRRGHILVATQVAEQSLDLDFDLVVSDLAPIDLLIQRAGRLWRHMDLRPAHARAIDGPKLLVVSPDPAQTTDAHWLDDCLGKAAFVYRNAGVMWRSATAIFERAAFQAPDDLRAMIEAVYAGDDEALPAALRPAASRDQGREAGEASLGQFNVVQFEHGYGGLPKGLSKDEDIGTRLGEATVTVRLARRVEGRLEPWSAAAGAPRAVAWALSEVRVREALWGKDTRPPPAEALLHAQTRQDWWEWEEPIRLAEVEPDGRLRLDGKDLTYDAMTGLCAVVPQARE